MDEQAKQSAVVAVGAIAAVPSILDVVCQITGMGFAAVARVTEDRWIACSVRDDIAFGLQPGGELDVTTTICHEVRQAREAVVIDHVSEDDRYCGHPTPARYGFQSYISMPIVLPDGSFFGTLCAIDPKPAVLRTPGVIGMFKLFADMIAYHLAAQLKVETAEDNLAREKETAALREEFIAVLGHDLRNPLAAISSGLRLLGREQVSDKGKGVLLLMGQSISRMTTLIANVLDFTQGRLGGGLTLHRETRDMQAALEQVVDELRTAMPDRMIQAQYDLTHAVSADGARIQQLLSNLVGNALTYGAPGHPVVVSAATPEGFFELSVVNYGSAIPDETMKRLFRPFFRGDVRRDQQGLGIGLHIASEIARAHGGMLAAACSEPETRFTFRMPL